MSALSEAAAAKETAALGRRLRDPVWRLTGLERAELKANAKGDWPTAPGSPLYWIKDAKGKTIRFKPNAAQLEIIHAIFVLGLLKILIPKARQLGMSTVVALIMLDMILFGAGVQGAIVDMTQADGTKKLKGKILFAFRRLPAALRDKYEVLKANDKTLSLRLRGSEDDTASEVQAGMNARGDTFQVLHISEWGKIAHADPPRSEEIVTGAMPAAKMGLVIVETTWKGGKVGHLWELTKDALEVTPENRTAEDFTVFFFPWWGDPDYTLNGDGRQITAACRKYLDETEKEIAATRKGFKFTAGQRLWYFKRAWKLGLFRFQEYPSMLSECFRAPVEGAIYAELIDAARAQGRIGNIEPDADALVHTCWDLGGPVNMVTWYFQIIGKGLADAELRFIDCDSGLDLTPGERVEWMRAKGYRFGYHFLPHDAATKMDKGRTVQAELELAGLENTRIIPRTADVWVGINRVRVMMPRMTWRVPQCDAGLNSLEAYHSGVWIEKGRSMDLPVHDRASHAADALRVLGEAEMAGMVEGEAPGSGTFDKDGLRALRGGAQSGK